MEAAHEYKSVSYPKQRGKNTVVINNMAQNVTKYSQSYRGNHPLK